MDILNRVYRGWRDVMENKSDPRTTNWFMMDSPLPTILLSATYLILVKVSSIIFFDIHFLYFLIEKINHHSISAL